MKLAIIDTKCANLASLKFALDRLGFKSEISCDLKVLENADKIFLPGVGTAFKAMENLRNLNLIDFIKNTKKPVLGICLGMQILGAFSEELNQKTLGIMSFGVRKFTQKPKFTLPHMGWNSIKIMQENALFKGLDEAYFYFVHSFCVALDDFKQDLNKFSLKSDENKFSLKSDDKNAFSNEFVLAKCDYSEEFAAAVWRNNFYGVQFHPERSGEAGEILLKNFVKM